MRILLALVAVMVLAVCAHAQLGPGGLSKSGPPKQEPAYRVDEKDYNRASKLVPDSTAKFDPWGGIREEPKAKKDAPKAKKQAPRSP